MPDEQPPPTPARMPGLTPGRVVHYVSFAGDEPYFAAIIAGVADPVAGIVNLGVFLPSGVAVAREAVPYHPIAADGTAPIHSWHWPERA